MDRRACRILGGGGRGLVDQQEKYKTGVAHDSPITPSVAPLSTRTGSGASFENIVWLGRG